MAFRAFAFPPDGRMHREEISAARLAAQQRISRSAQQDGSKTPQEPKPDGQSEPASPDTASQVKRRNVVLTDPLAFKSLESDPSVKVVHRRAVLREYELYLVEQWACSRQSQMVIATYTGDERHSVVVGVLAVPSDDSTWSPNLREYFAAVAKYHGRSKDTPLGELMVTNLSSFPSALTVIQVPEGDIKKYRQVFFVNEDLKRMGCSGRSGLTLSNPTAATQAKFHQLYKTSERIPIMQSVLELVRMCQVALFMFGALKQPYSDGLLCDWTETAIGDWWTELGAEHYNIEPTDGILGPTTVAALLGMLMGARNRLNWCNFQVAKDVFDLEGTTRGISQFQKAYRLERTKRLDRQTMLKLHQVTAKAAAGDGWGVQKAVKSTVAEIGGKRGEMVMEMVSGRDKAGLGDIETLDIDKFISLAYGGHAKYLWRGKPMRPATDQHDGKSSDAGHITFGKDDLVAPGLKRALAASAQEELERWKDESIYSAPPLGSSLSVGDSPGEKDEKRKTVFKSVAGSVASNTRSGIGRIKDVVGASRRGHGSRPSKDELPDSAFSSALNSPSIAVLAQASTALSSPAGVNRAFTWKNKPEEYMTIMRRDGEADFPPVLVPLVADTEKTEVDSGNGLNEAGDAAHGKRFEGEFNDFEDGNRKDQLLEDPSVAGSATDHADILDRLLGWKPPSVEVPRCLQRSLSARRPPQPLNENRWPRRMSFGDAEEAVLGWDDVIDIPPDVEDIDSATLQRHADLAEFARTLYASIAGVKDGVSPWTDAKLAELEALDARLAADHEALRGLYAAQAGAALDLRRQAPELAAEERAVLTASLREAEALAARLEYEVAALGTRVGEAEDGAAAFERQVEALERRAEELKAQLETESWAHWFVRTLTGIGTGPNITRAAK